MAFPGPILFAIASLLLLAYLRSKLRWRSRSRGLPFPPGPHKIPIFGNAFTLPQSRPWIVFKEVSQQLRSDILYYKVLGQVVIVLNSPATINELLNKRSANTSDRLQTSLIDIAGLDWSFLFMPYGPRLRHHRRLFSHYFSSSAIENYQLVQTQSARNFLRKLLDEPHELKEHIRLGFVATMMKIIYDNENEEDIERQGTMLEQLQLCIQECFEPGKFFAQIIPFAHRLPDWLLGPELQRKAPQWRVICHGLRNMVFDKAREDMDRNPNHDSIVKSFFSEVASHANHSGEDEDEREVIKNVMTIAFEGGADTTYSTLQSVYLALSLYPRVVEKAQAELDAVVGPHRLPEFKDRSSLVYINAIVKEAFRWQNVAPLSAPHANIADEVIDGYFIPAGSMLISNMWACLHDPEAYPDPFEFVPERYIKDGKLDPDLPDPYDYVFGAGRRICPGRFIADESVYINVASALHVFDIGPPRDEHGKIIHIKPEMTDTLLSYPEDCRCTITPRSPSAEALILDAIA